MGNVENRNKTPIFSKDIEAMRCDVKKSHFIERIYKGDTFHEACAYIKVNPVALAVVRREDVDFEAMIKDARAYRADILVDSLNELPAIYDDAAMVAAVSRNIQWLAKTRYRELYGDKTDINHNVTVNIKDAMNAARARVMQDVTPNLLIDNDSATDVVSVAPVEEAEEIDPLS